MPAIAWGGGNPPADPDPNRFAKDIQAFEEWDAKNAIPADPVLFVGSSTIRLWRTHESFPDLPIVNRGFGGSHISEVNYYAERIVLPYKPKLIVFYAGDNDIGAGKSAQRVFEDYRRFTQIVHANLPPTRILFLSIKPSESRWKFWPEAQRANDLIRSLSKDDPRLLFADMGTCLLAPDGKPKSDLFQTDKLHLNPAGYAVWTQTLTPILKQTPATP